MTKIDYRKNYILILDTETANTFLNEGKLDCNCPLVYDCGYIITDTKGNIYKKASFINADVFLDMKDIMKTAYYANKIPQYWQRYKKGETVLTSFYNIRKAIAEDIKEYRIKSVCAHNARFDVNALNATQRYLTKSKYRFFFPATVDIWDSLQMARSVIGKMPTYKKFCIENDYMTKNNQVRLTAEILYRFISKNNDFSEKHTGLEDVLIEHEIVKYCYKQHKPMKKILYRKRVDNVKKI